MEGPASLVAITIPSSSVPARSLTLEISANTLRKVSVEGESMKDHANFVVDIAAWEHDPFLSLSYSFPDTLLLLIIICLLWLVLNYPT